MVYMYAMLSTIIKIRVNSWREWLFLRMEGSLDCSSIVALFYYSLSLKFTSASSIYVTFVFSSLFYCEKYKCILYNDNKMIELTNR